MAEIIDAVPEGGRDLSSAVTVTHVMYGLHALAPFTLWLLAIAAMLIGVFKRDDVRGTWLDSHFAWLAGTFWWGILFAIIAWGAYFVLSIITLGIGALLFWVLPAAVFVWYLYRVIKGWLKLNDRLPIVAD